MLGQELRRFLADMAYSEREQQTRKVVLLRALYGLNKIICRLLLMSLESCYFACRYVIYIGYIRYQTLRDKLFDECIAESFNIHGITRAEMDNISQKLRRTLGIDAADSRLTLLTDNGSGAGRTNRWQDIGLGIFCVRHNAHDLRDYIARFSYGDLVTDADILFGDEILIVERCAADCRARKQNRLKHGGRSEHARAPDTYLYVYKLCRLFLRRIFESHRPFGEFRSAAEASALNEIVNFYNSAVYIIFESRAYLPDALELPYYIRYIIKSRIERDCMKALLAQEIERLLM